MPDSTWRVCYSSPGSVERGSSFLYIVCRIIFHIYIYIICYCPCCMLHVCACGATYARRSLAVWRQLTTHTRARREPAQLHRGAHPWPTLHSAPCCCRAAYTYTYIYIPKPKLVLRARPPLAGGAPWSPTRDRGPCEARAKELRLSLGDDAHQEEQRARLAAR